jgi:hypothetical protein
MSYELAVKELSNMLNMINASYSIEHLVDDGGVYVNIFNPDDISRVTHFPPLRRGHSSSLSPVTGAESG